MAFEQEKQFALESVICEHHVYEQVWMPRMGEQLDFCMNLGNEHNLCAVYA